MSGGTFEVEPGDLVAHASHLGGIVDRLNQAVQASDYAISDDAYGLLCSFLPAIVNPTGEQAKDALTASVEGFTTIAYSVGSAADSYRNSDRSAAEPFKGQTQALA